jgi:hypothetical protein
MASLAPSDASRARAAAGAGAVGAAPGGKTRDGVEGKSSWIIDTAERTPAPICAAAGFGGGALLPLSIGIAAHCGTSDEAASASFGAGRTRP